MLSRQRLFEISFQHNFHVQPSTADFSDQRYDSEGQQYVLGHTIAHQFEFAVRRYEVYGVLGLEFREFHALVKVAVVDENGRSKTGLDGDLHRTVLVIPPSVSGFHDDVVVDAELTLGHAAQIRLHPYATVDVRGQHLSLHRHQQVDVLHNVQEQFAAPVLDALPAPAD